uniref:Putative RecA n=1 Tax=viral metagenome TaxID=1070528 RepID=A0A6M3L7X7_9ZZZZ
MLKRRTKELVEEVKETIEKPVDPPKSIRFDKVLSTGSTLLDLAIAGDKVRGGGIPGGIMMEIAGPPMSGKSALLMEIIGSCVHRGGDYRIGDPEGRLDEEYIQIYGVPLNREKYHRDKLVSEIFKTLYIWKPTPEVPDAICVYGEDSLAALSTELEMEGEDKRGQRRAKEFSEGCRKTCIKLADNNWLFVATNQIREGDGMGFKTTGGWAVPHYSSVRVSANFAYPKSKIEKIVKINNKEIKKIIGVECLCKVVKNSVSSPFREANIHIVFNVGIDDVRGNLQWLKDVLGLTKYWTPSGEFQSMEKAIIHIEQNNLEKELREATIDTWLDIESKFKIERKSKERW